MIEWDPFDYYMKSVCDNIAIDICCCLRAQKFALMWILHINSAHLVYEYYQLGTSWVKSPIANRHAADRLCSSVQSDSVNVLAIRLHL